MAASYKKLWKLLIDKDMKKEDLRKATGITTTAIMPRIQIRKVIKSREKSE